MCSAVSRKSVPSALSRIASSASGSVAPEPDAPLSLSTVICPSSCAITSTCAGRSFAASVPVRGSMQRLTTDAAASSAILILLTMSIPLIFQILRVQRRVAPLLPHQKRTQDGPSCPCVGKRRKIGNVQTRQPRQVDQQRNAARRQREQPARSR